MLTRRVGREIAMPTSTYSTDVTNDIYYYYKRCTDTRAFVFISRTGNRKNAARDPCRKSGKKTENRPQQIGNDWSIYSRWNIKFRPKIYRFRGLRNLPETLSVRYASYIFF